MRYTISTTESGDAFPALLVSMEIEAKHKGVVKETISGGFLTASTHFGRCWPQGWCLEARLGGQNVTFTIHNRA